MSAISIFSPFISAILTERFLQKYYPIFNQIKPKSNELVRFRSATHPRSCIKIDSIRFAILWGETEKQTNEQTEVKTKPLCGGNCSI